MSRGEVAPVFGLLRDPGDQPLARGCTVFMYGLLALVAGVVSLVLSFTSLDRADLLVRGAAVVGTVLVPGGCLMIAIGYLLYRRALRKSSTSLDLEGLVVMDGRARWARCRARINEKPVAPAGEGVYRLEAFDVVDTQPLGPAVLPPFELRIGLAPYQEVSNYGVASVVVLKGEEELRSLEQRGGRFWVLSRGHLSLMLWSHGKTNTHLVADLRELGNALSALEPFQFDVRIVFLVPREGAKPSLLLGLVGATISAVLDVRTKKRLERFLAGGAFVDPKTGEDIRSLAERFGWALTLKQ